MASRRRTRKRPPPNLNAIHGHLGDCISVIAVAARSLEMRDMPELEDELLVIRHGLESLSRVYDELDDASVQLAHHRAP